MCVGGGGGTYILVSTGYVPQDRVHFTELPASAQGVFFELPELAQDAFWNFALLAPDVACIC